MDGNQEGWGASRPGHRVSLLREERRAGFGGEVGSGCAECRELGLEETPGRSGGSRAEKREVGVLGRQERERGSPSTKEGCVKAHQGREEMGLGG